MTFEELVTAIDGLYAYDSGCTDSGIHDEQLRRRVRDHLDSLTGEVKRVVLSKLVRRLTLSDETLARGYGWEDAMHLCQWIDNDL